MLPLKIFKEFRDLKFLFLNNFQFRNISLCPLTYWSSLSDCNLHNTVEENKRIPLDEISSLCSLNYDEEAISTIVKEIQWAKSNEKKLPQYIKLSDIDNLLQSSTMSQRLKYLTFLFKKEIKKINAKEKKIKKKVEYENRSIKKILDTDHIQYGLGKNTLVLRAWKRNLHKFYDKRLANSVLFGQKLVVDLGYDEHMEFKERKNCASQVRLLYNDNKLNRNPYDLYFCNANPNSKGVQYLREEIPTIDESLVTISEKSYLDFFPKDSLVYLSPHASESLKTYDHKAVYIIGGFVDTIKRTPVSSCKANNEGIKTYSLPLSEYVLWGSGSKSLSINQVFLIMLTFRDTGDWMEAFKHIPTRKLRRIQADSGESHHFPDKLFVMSN